MKFCVLEIKTQTSTFRNPEFQNFHKSLKLPPPSTLVGLAGAALGLNPKAAQAYFETNDFTMGVYGKSQGLAKDLWKYNNFSTGGIVLKEILFINHFILVYGCNKEDVINELENAFINPYYALTLGNSDSLAKITKVEVINEISEHKELAYCWVEGDIIKDVYDNIDKDINFSIYTSSDAIMYDLPSHFTYASEYGVRKVVKRKQLSFIGEKMTLNLLKKGIYFNNIFIPIFQYPKLS